MLDEKATVNPYNYRRFQIRLRQNHQFSQPDREFHRPETTPYANYYPYVDAGTVVNVVEATLNEWGAEKSATPVGTVIHWDVEMPGTRWELRYNGGMNAVLYDELRRLEKGAKVTLVGKAPQVVEGSYHEWLNSYGIGLHAPVDNIFAEVRKPRKAIYTVMAELVPGLWVVNMDLTYSIRREMFLTEELHVVQAWEE